MKICNNENKKKKYNKEYIKRAEFKDEKEKVKNFMKDNLFGVKSDNLNDELIKEYLENMDKNAEKAIKYVNEKKDENEKINE